MEVHEDTSQKSPDEMDENKSETPVTGTDRKSLTYSSYLKVDNLLEFQKTLTPVHDEHLFIVVHQVFELWFKQIIYELDAVCKAMDVECINDINLLVITVRTSRIVRILKLMLKQFTVLETIPVTDFENLRNYIGPGSSFQSLQFRLLENMLGVKDSNRMYDSGMNYKNMFKGSELDRIEQSEKGPTLLQLVDRWLSKTPGLEKDGFNFWYKYTKAVNSYLSSLQDETNKVVDPDLREELIEENIKTAELFETILVREKHDELVKNDIRMLSYRAIQGAILITYFRNIFKGSELDRIEQSEKGPTLLQLVDRWLAKTPGLEKDGFNFWYKYTKAVNSYLSSLQDETNKVVDPDLREELIEENIKTAELFESILIREKHDELVKNDIRMLSHRAIQGAILITYFRTEARLNQRYHYLVLLMDLETYLAQWRHNLVLLARRFGDQAKNYGFSGYRYFTSTFSNRYGIFNDLFNISTFLPPAKFFPSQKPSQNNTSKRIINEWQ
ncbi:Tryptophan 2,3-dioxygenase A [Trichoplax sp. H2]|nr:Tryptophan 2,3-dioxygenase A [Trichoplax sp. H2]|eukprot:RDD42454.1 Tryptophan 2,3-dioxygenase A [Trichoplax sp. H2]